MSSGAGDGAGSRKKIPGAGAALGQLRNPGSQEYSFYCFICEFFNAIPLEREIRKKFAKEVSALSRVANVFSWH